MKVSIITATYNSADTVGKCISSVLKQSYPDIEYLIIDGNSKDNTIAKVRALTDGYDHIRLISERDKGIYDALNKGISKASGTIIGFVHSDDFLASEDIISQIVKIFKDQNVDGVYGNLHYVAADNTDKVIRNWISQAFRPSLLKQGWMPAHPTLYLKSTVYQTYGAFNLDYRIAADYEFVLRIFKQPELRFSYLPDTIVKMRVGGASNRSLRNIIQKSKEDYRAIRQHQLGTWWTIVQKNGSKIKQFFPNFKMTLRK
ncbi:glycosyltransferase family 2 protein [Winogradskyella aurantia]|uniref:Glycosyl transferase n=1 Tax=Winogradskyella aurantia TaxID=1915063 RepID=A0A265UVX4_9FLAO|nr:glycosyltransferase family 2 protein [Winogradskyella aurantia]OZV69227.1 glycosyl transferase [Winogradskyella aurantia]